MEEVRRFYPLTHAQKRIWYTEKMYPGTSVNNVVSTNLHDQPLRSEFLIKAIQNVIESHDALRLQLNNSTHGIQQYFVDANQYHIKTYNFRSQEELDTWCHKKARNPIKLLNNKLCEFAVIHTHDHRSGYFINIHHIIVDALSLSIISNQIWEAYWSLQENSSLPEFENPSFVEAIENEKKYMESKTYLKNKLFWEETFSTVPEPLGFKKKTDIQSFQSKRWEFFLSESLTKALRDFCTEHGISISNLIFTCLLIYLYRKTGKKQMPVGTITHNRSGAVEKQMVGMFVSTVIYPGTIYSDMQFLDFVQFVSKDLLKCFRHQKYPYDLLLQDLRNTKNYKEDLLEAVFSYDNVTMPFAYKWYYPQADLASLVIHVTEKECTEKLKFDIDYRIDTFEEWEIAQIQCVFTCLLKNVLLFPTKPIGSLKVMTEYDRKQILNFSPAQLPLKSLLPVHKRFEFWANENPNSIAVVTDKDSITYGELNRQANQLALFLTKNGVGPDIIVGFHTTRSIDMVISMLGILKAGGAYLPIATDVPVGRIESIVNDSKMKYLITTDYFKNKLKKIPNTIFLSDKAICKQERYDINNENDPQDLMYVIYTSGSTGKPKGVQVPHLGFVNLLEVYKEEFKTCQDDRFSQVASKGFDAMAFEVWPCLTEGASLHIANDQVRHDPFLLFDWLLTNEITKSFQPTTIAEILIQTEWPDDTKLKYLLTAGDRLTSIPQKELPFDFYNLYGPTEDTVWTTFSKIDNNCTTSIPTIGKPIQNHQVYIFNDELQLQQIGMPGELCISGIGLSRGYLNRDDLTANKYISNPINPSERLYRTGDKVRWLPNGDLEFLGRLDHQVKLRGFRIELGEIESTLVLHNKISDAVVVVQEDQENEKSLCAYIVNNSRITDAEIREYLSTKLPDYMIPWYFKRLEKMPITTHGKVDRKALPPISTNIDRGAPYIPPRSLKESTVAKAWHDVLHIKQIGIKDNFFILGGDSIKAIQICYELQKYGYQLEVADIFEDPTVEGVCQSLKPIRESIDQSLVFGGAPLHPIQKWFFETVETEKHIWNQTILLKSKSGWQSHDIQNAWNKLIVHHDALRMRFIESNPHRQQNTDNLHNQYYYHYQDIRREVTYFEKMEMLIKELQTKIDLENGPLVVIGHFATREGDYLAIIIHHLVVDGISWRILLEDFSLALTENNNYETKFPQKTNSYITWTQRLSQIADEKLLNKDYQYWKNLDFAHTEVLAKDASIGNRDHKNWCVQKLVLTEDQTNKLLLQSNTCYQTEISDILLTALINAFYEWKGIHKIAICLEGHGREPIIQSINIMRTVGWFTSLFPIILKKNVSSNIGYQIKSVKEMLRRIPNKGIGYGLLKYNHSGALPPSMKISPEIAFNYLGQLDIDLKLDDTNMQIVGFDLERSHQSQHPFALEFNAIIWNRRMEILLGYHSKEFFRETISNLLGSYENNIGKIIEHCTKQQEIEYTPSDFGDLSLSLEELEIISEYIGQLELES